jgi:hypothetical protein
MNEEELNCQSCLLTLRRVETYPKSSQPSENSSCLRRVRAVRLNLIRTVRSWFGQTQEEGSRSCIQDLTIESVAREGSTQMEECAERHMEEGHEGDEDETKGYHRCVCVFLNCVVLGCY